MAIGQRQHFSQSKSISANQTQFQGRNSLHQRYVAHSGVHSGVLDSLQTSNDPQSTQNYLLDVSATTFPVVIGVYERWLARMALGRICTYIHSDFTQSRDLEGCTVASHTTYRRQMTPNAPRTTS